VGKLDCLTPDFLGFALQQFFDGQRGLMSRAFGLTGGVA
jgi:hypothetical protein